MQFKVFITLLLTSCYRWASQHTEENYMDPPCSPDVYSAKYPCVIPYDDIDVESIQDKRDFNLRGLSKLHSHVIMLRDFMIHKLEHQMNLECAVLFLSDIKDILYSYSYWYGHSEKYSLHDSSVKYHIKKEGSPRIIAVRKSQVLDLSCDICCICNTVKEYAKVASDVNALDLLIKQLQRVNMECDRYLEEFWVQFPSNTKKTRKTGRQPYRN